MKRNVLLSLIGIIVMGITACGGSGITSSSTSNVESVATAETTVTEESESVAESVESAAQSTPVESKTDSNSETQFVGLVEDGVFSITDVISEAEVIIVPESINGVTVGKIKKEAFYDLQCKRIVIPNTVTSIGKSAFLGCDQLETIELGNGLTSIGAFAFQGCKNLRTITFADGLKTIKGNLFFECSELGEVFIPDSVTEIEDGLGDITTCPNLIVVASAGSRAEAVAIEEGIPVKNS